MPSYHRLGTIPRKRHVAFRRPDGSLHSEELMGSHGFSGPSSLLYHLHAPTRVTATRVVAELAWEVETDPSRPLRLETVWGVGYRYRPQGGPRG